MVINMDETMLSNVRPWKLGVVPSAHQAAAADMGTVPRLCRGRVCWPQCATTPPCRSICHRCACREPDLRQPLVPPYWPPTLQLVPRSLLITAVQVGAPAPSWSAICGISNAELPDWHRADRWSLSWMTAEYTPATPPWRSALDCASLSSSFPAA